MKKFILITLGVFSVLFITAGITLMSMNKSLPLGTRGPEVSELTKKIEDAVALSKWKNLEAVEFVFALNDYKHFRDLKRDLVEVKWGKEPTYRVQYNNKNRSEYKVWIDEKILEPKKAIDLVEQAYKQHTNDFFWLNPFSMLQAPGTIRSFVGDQALLVTFESGGVTPGDSYLIITDENGRPTRLQMWVSILPIKGIEWSCDSWVQTPGGAWLNENYEGGIISVGLENIKTWSSYPSKKEDRFASLLPLLGTR